MHVCSLFRQLTVLGLVAVASRISAQTYEIIDLGTLGGSASQAQGINARGQVVGWSLLDDEEGPHAFLWSDGELSDLGTLKGKESYAFDINNGGQVSGFSSLSDDPGNVIYHAFRWEDGQFTDLKTTGGLQSRGYGINAAGEVVGASMNDPTFGNEYAFWFHGGEMEDLGGLFGSSDSSAFRLNNHGQVVGQSITGQPRHATLWESGDVIDLGTLGGLNSWAFDVNDDGLAVGLSDASGNRAQHAFIIDLSTRDMIDLGLPSGFFHSYAYAINGHGEAVGDAVDQYIGIRHATLFRDGDAFDLNEMIPDDSGWELESAADINDVGQIVGVGLIKGARHAFLLNPTDPCRESLKADANCDSQVNFNDIDFFVAALSENESQYLNFGGSEQCWALRSCWGDVDRNGEIDFDDIDPFVACVVNGGCP